HSEQHIARSFPTAFAFIDLALSLSASSSSSAQLPPHPSILVACQQGISRSASLVIAYVMRRLGLPLADAYEHVKDRSPWVAPNMWFLGQLAEFEVVMR
ncbi:dual specificity phosphatase, partial [Zopfochytrium polystomum]